LIWKNIISMTTCKLTYCKYYILSTIYVSWFYWIKSCVNHSCGSYRISYLMWRRSMPSLTIYINFNRRTTSSYRYIIPCSNNYR
jgi:hypothetical protein